MYGGLDVEIHVFLTSTLFGENCITRSALLEINLEWSNEGG
jgi:hypothetical protein